MDPTAFGGLCGLYFWIPLCTSLWILLPLLHCRTLQSTWLLNSYTQQQPGECGADQRLQGVEKVRTSTLVLQGEGRWVEPGSVNCTDSLIVTLLPVRKCCYGEVKVKAVC